MQRAGQDDSFGVTREMAYDGDMDDITDPADALRGLRQLATPPRVPSDERMNQGGLTSDVTTREIALHLP